MCATRARDACRDLDVCKALCLEDLHYASGQPARHTSCATQLRKAESTSKQNKTKPYALRSNHHAPSVCILLMKEDICQHTASCDLLPQGPRRRHTHARAHAYMHTRACTHTHTHTYIYIYTYTQQAGNAQDRPASRQTRDQVRGRRRHTGRAGGKAVAEDLEELRALHLLAADRGTECTLPPNHSRRRVRAWVLARGVRAYGASAYCFTWVCPCVSMRCVRPVYVCPRAPTV